MMFTYLLDKIKTLNTMSMAENEEYGAMWLSTAQAPSDNVSSSDESESAEDQNLEIVTGPLVITNLPPEIFQLILRYLSFENIAKLRCVNQFFNAACSTILNCEFNRLRLLMQQRFQQIKSQMPRRESARRKHPLARESDIIETLHMRLSLLHMTFGKHIERKHCCFFAGEILDEVYRILKYVRNTPSLSRAYKVTDELFDLSTMAMEYFKEHIETTLPEISYFAADFLDYPPSSPKVQVSLLDETLAGPSTSTMKSGIEIPPSYSITDPEVANRMRKMKENIKKNNDEVVGLQQSLKMARKKLVSHQKEIQQLKLQHEEFDKKFLINTRKLNSVSQELTQYKTEAQQNHFQAPASQNFQQSHNFQSPVSQRFQWPASESLRIPVTQNFPLAPNVLDSYVDSDDSTYYDPHSEALNALDYSDNEGLYDEIDYAYIRRFELENRRPHFTDDNSDEEGPLDSVADDESIKPNCVTHNNLNPFRTKAMDSNKQTNHSTQRITENPINHDEHDTFLQNHNFFKAMRDECFRQEQIDKTPDPKKIKLSNQHQDNLNKCLKASPFYSFKFKNNTATMPSSLVSSAEVAKHQISQSPFQWGVENRDYKFMKRPPIKRKHTKRFLRHLKRCDETEAKVNEKSQSFKKVSPISLCGSNTFPVNEQADHSFSWSLDDTSRLMSELQTRAYRRLHNRHF